MVRGSKGMETSLERKKSSEATEDYLELIDLLVLEKGFASTTDVAERLGVSKSSVTSKVKKLHKQGYLVHTPYRGMALTDSGRNLARNMKSRHETLRRFLLLLGVSNDIATEDAERIEHGLHPETVRKIRKLVERLEENKVQI
ncbi:MAG TPA: iron dependent repressor, metal binding and dimerization domain protein [Nitrososphaerales archaeon]|nr:iron dependent repressor, metal binding and dimerization domain protein [Nitrososphaerales archaeon]